MHALQKWVNGISKGWFSGGDRVTIQENWEKGNRAMSSRNKVSEKQCLQGTSVGISFMEGSRGVQIQSTVKNIENDINMRLQTFPGIQAADRFCKTS